MKDGVPDDDQSPSLVNQEDVEEDKEKMFKFANDQFSQLKRQEVTGEFTLTGTDTGIIMGMSILNLIIGPNELPVNAVVLDVNTDQANGVTIISIGKP